MYRNKLFALLVHTRSSFSGAPAKPPHQSNGDLQGIQCKASHVRSREVVHVTKSSSASDKCLRLARSGNPSWELQSVRGTKLINDTPPLASLPVPTSPSLRLHLFPHHTVIFGIFTFLCTVQYLQGICAAFLSALAFAPNFREAATQASPRGENFPLPSAPGRPRGVEYV